MNSADPKSLPDEKEVESTIPTAIVQPAKVGLADVLKGSYMWLVALACLLLAIGIVWWSIPEQGLQISVHFPEGHGLNAEDAVRFRGIDVGIVEDVELNHELSGVDVTVNLFPFAEPLAREGTRFWIVRPELSLGGISGLETAVGSKYIGLIPGDENGTRKTDFTGLLGAPPDALENPGIEIIVRSDQRHGVTAGSPVSCRGINVGRVLSVGLSQDGRSVDVRARIYNKFTHLVTDKTKFWATSGVDLDFSFGGGLKLDMESLETLARGGISMLTTEGGGKPLFPGQVFEPLFTEPGDDWFEEAAKVQNTNIDLRGALPMETSWQQKGLLGVSEKRNRFIGTYFKNSTGSYALIPGDVLATPKKAVEDSFAVSVSGKPDTRTPVADPSESAIVKWELKDSAGLPSPLAQSDCRIPSGLESCVAVRASDDSGEFRFLHYAIDRADIGANWLLKNFNGDRAVWHGAPILSSADGKLIGFLLVGRHETRIEVLSNEWLNPTP